MKISAIVAVTIAAFAASTTASPLRGGPSEIVGTTLFQAFATDTCDQSLASKVLTTCGYLQYQQDNDAKKFETSVCSAACKSGLDELVKACGSSSQISQLKSSMDQLSSSCSSAGYSQSSAMTSFVSSKAAAGLAAASAAAMYLL